MLTTNRLRFETWRPEDINLLFELHSDPLVQLSYAPGPNKWTIEGITRLLTRYMDEQAMFGFTKWKLCLADGTFIGRGGWSPDGEGTIEIGYAIKPEFWNSGYASEAAHALMNWAQAHHPHYSLVGFALPHNVASIKILQKVGMQFLDHREIAGAEFAFYTLNA